MSLTSAGSARLTSRWPETCIDPDVPGRSRIATTERHRTALLLIDVINDMDFDGSETLVRLAEPMAKKLRVLKRRARAAGIPTIYINDNFGKWRSDFRAHGASTA